jgi:hypothetical protein
MSTLLQRHANFQLISHILPLFPVIYNSRRAGNKRRVAFLVCSVASALNPLIHNKHPGVDWLVRSIRESIYVDGEFPIYPTISLVTVR